ncbi:MAG: hypothetical protein Q9M97_05430 [Candidatus Gracilibacteria bacterium]|nr:hypothetical protein [Candidatus Gracilibacteria bacterium]
MPFSDEIKGVELELHKRHFKCENWQTKIFTEKNLIFMSNFGQYTNDFEKKYIQWNWSLLVEIN